MVRNCIALCALVLVVTLACAGPAAAEGIAVYGSTGGFIPAQHADRFTVAYTIPAPNGQALDANVASMVDPSIDVIFIGSDDSFSAATAAAIEQAAWDGKILVVSYPATARFGDSLPFTGTGVQPGSDALETAAPGNTVTRSVLAGLAPRFNATAPAGDRLAVSAKPGSSTLLRHSTGEPALAYRQYGDGFVIGWTVEDPSVYLGRGDADALIYRLITALLEGRAVETVSPTAMPTTAVTPVPPDTTGTVIISSNPVGATVFLDGLFRGQTPLELSGIPAGYHSLKMTMEGRYDFDGSVTAVAGETVTAFGSLPKEEGSGTGTGTPAPSPTMTAPAGSDNPLASPVVIGGAITAAIGALATIYSQKQKKP